MMNDTMDLMELNDEELEQINGGFSLCFTFGYGYSENCDQVGLGFWPFF